MDGLDLVNKLWYVVYKGKERYLRFAFGWKMICDALEIGEFKSYKLYIQSLYFLLELVNCKYFCKNCKCF